jgi:hypothetical protein
MLKWKMDFFSIPIESEQPLMIEPIDWEQVKDTIKTEIRKIA